jgi:O-methyltransferase involved in polyketide biosynthesis
MTVAIQGTNDSCTMSKYSTLKAQYLLNEDGSITSDKYTRHFISSTKKIQTRSPLIHRGYYLRMKAINDLFLALKRTIMKDNLTTTILNIGCGYDTTFFQLKDQMFPFTNFVDLDYPTVIRNKSNLIMRCDLPFYENLHEAVYTDGEIRSRDYSCVGCDLFDLKKV